MGTNSGRDQKMRHCNTRSNGTSRGANNLRVLIERRCFAPLTLNDDAGYHKLPQLQLLKLSILKLHGSAFGNSHHSLSSMGSIFAVDKLVFLKKWDSPIYSGSSF